MRRDGAQRSAHDVARENLAHMEDIGLLGHLLAEARRDLDERAGPDREAQIVALAPRADVPHANEELTGAQSSLRRAEERRKGAETALVAANTRPTRALLPGPVSYTHLALTSTPEDREAVVHLAIARLEETRATWGRSDVTEVLTTLVTGTSADELRARVEQAADEVLRDHRVCSLAAPLPAEPPDALRRRDQMSAIERHGATRYTTEATLRSEARVLDAVANGRLVRVGLVPERTVDIVLSLSLIHI